MIDRVGQTWRVISSGDTFLFVRSWSVPEGTCHEILCIEAGTSEEWIESSNSGPLEWRDRQWQRLS